jgi:Flp pilus assembly protein TadB
MLMTPLLLAAAIAGVPPQAMGLVVVGALSPSAALVLGFPAGLMWWRRKHPSRNEPIDEAAFCSGVAAELRAGASLRHALAAAAERDPAQRLAAPVRAALAGAPAGEVAARLQEALPINGRHAALAFRLASSTGAGAAAVFTRLAAGANAAAESRRERNALTAQARLSAMVVGGAPIGTVAVLLATGRLDTLGSSGGIGVAVGAIGLGLVGLGLAIVWVMLRGTTA